MKRILSRIAAMGAVCAALIVPPAFATGDVATISTDAGAIAWQPRIAHDGLVLTVSRPDGAVDRFEVGAGTVPFYSVFERNGQARPEGVYVWELRILPVVDAATRALLDEGRRRGDDSVADRLRAEGRLPLDTVQTGAFSIAGGEIVASGLEEAGGRAAAAGDESAAPLAPAQGRAAGGPVARDQVIPDDLIVQGSECVGVDCVNNENFGFDTIRLKENNLRIKFEDTSVGSFPSTDWQLTANDSASGGLNRFSIEDITAARVPFTIEGSAPTNSLYVDDAGRIGNGTATPVLDVHILSGNTPAIRLEQDGSSGFTAQTWDIAGNEAVFFVRDTTGGSLLPFKIQPGASTNSLVIALDGQIGVGELSPDAAVHITRNGSSENAAFLLENTGGTTASSWFFQVQSANGAFVVTPNTAGTNAPLKIFTGAPENSITVGQNGGGTSPRVGIHRVSSVQHPIHVGTDATNGNGAHVTAAGIWTDGSSRVHKTEIVDLDEADALATLAELNPVRYKGKEDTSGEEYLGFIAEDVPALVAMNGRNGLSPMDIVAVLTKSLQAQQKQNADMATRLAELEALVQQLRAPATP